MGILRCGMLLSILLYQLLVIAVAQNACIYSADTEGICRPYADCKELHHKVIFKNDDCEANTYCCPNNLITPPHINNINNYKPEFKPNHENPALPDELIHAIWDEPAEDRSQPPFAFTPAGENIEIPRLPKPDFNDDLNSNPTYEPEVQENPNINAPWGNSEQIFFPVAIPGIQQNPAFNAILNSNPTYEPEVQGNPNINAPWDNGEQIFFPVAVPGFQVYPEIPQLHNPAVNAILNTNPTYMPEFQENPNINALWGNGEQIFPPIAVPGIPVHPSIAIPVSQANTVNDLVKVPDFRLDPSTTAIVTESATQTTPKPITTTTTEAIPVFDKEFYRRLGLAFGNKYNAYQQQDVVTPQIDVETSTVDELTEEVTTNSSSVMSNLNQLGLYKLNSQKCGFVHIENDPSESNTEAHLLEFPWLALLRYESGSRTPNFSCAGSLITERWVLTAASCIRKTLIGVRLGEYKISTKSNKDCVRNLCSVYKDYKIAITVKHADYKPETGVKDIALIKLKARVDMTKNIKTICLPTKVEHFNVPYDNTPLTISGWGLNKTDATEVMKKHAISRSKSRVCQQALPEQRVHQSKLCLATRHEEPSTCSGDNGGPIIWLVNDNTQFFTQIGVVPFGMDKCGAADGIISSYYVESVADSMDWITKVIGEDE